MIKKSPFLPVISLHLVLGIVSIGFVVRISPISHPVPLTSQDGGGDKKIILHTNNWAFRPSTIRVKKGEDVSLHLMGIQGDHGIAIPELGINEPMLIGGNSMVKIPTDTPGAYEFFCSVACGSGHSDMTGVLIIE